jgi:hypothetical protein
MNRIIVVGGNNVIISPSKAIFKKIPKHQIAILQKTVI